MEKRNIMQPKSTKKPKQLKNNLKFKVAESREAREFLDNERKKLKGVGKKTKKRKSKRKAAVSDE